jgi:hypothetical protein
LIKARKFSYLTLDDEGVIQLKKCESRGYYAQIQLLMMALCDVDCAYFVVWTTVDSKILSVPFDKVYWLTDLLHSIKVFFETYISTELLTNRVKRGLKLMDSSACDVTMGEASRQPPSDTFHRVESTDSSLGAGSNTSSFVGTCANVNCIDATAPHCIRGKTIACNVNLRCQQNSFFHLA